MADPVVTPAPPVTPAPAAVTPAPVTPAPVTPAPAATPEAGKTLLETAKSGEPVVPPAPVKAEEVVPVPEKYDIKDFKAPEGVTLDQAALDAFTPVAKALGLKADGVQKLLDYQASQAKEAQAKQKESDEKAQAEMLKADLEYSTKQLGTKAAERLAFVAKVRDQFMSKELMELPEIKMVGNNYHWLTFLENLGKRISPEKIIEGGAGPENDPTKSAAAVMFPSMSK